MVLLNSTGIWAQGYADDIVICTTGKEISTVSELMQNALSKIQNWCVYVGLTVNPNKAELLLLTNKKKYSMQQLSMFNTSIPRRQKVKYLGVNIDNKLNWKSHVETKLNKCTGLLLQCKRITGIKWGVHPKYLSWIYNAIIKPIFLHGVIVWWQFCSSESNQRYISRLNRLAALTFSNSFKTTPTAALEYLLDLTPLHIIIQSHAMRTCYRLMASNQWDSNHKYGHNTIFNLLTTICSPALMPSDSIPRTLVFGMTHVKFEVPDRERWIERDVKTDYDINVYTDGSRNDLGVGSGVYITSNNNPPFVRDIEEFQCLGNTVTVFQAEITAVSNALTTIQFLEGLNIAIYIDSQAAMHALNSHIHTSKIVLECRNKLKLLGHRNNIKVIWVPGHIGIYGNEQAD